MALTPVKLPRLIRRSAWPRALVHTRLQLLPLALSGDRRAAVWHMPEFTSQKPLLSCSRARCHVRRVKRPRLRQLKATAARCLMRFESCAAGRVHTCAHTNANTHTYTVLGAGTQDGSCGIMRVCATWPPDSPRPRKRSEDPRAPWWRRMGCSTWDASFHGASVWCREILRSAWFSGRDSRMEYFLGFEVALVDQRERMMRGVGSIRVFLLFRFLFSGEQMSRIFDACLSVIANFVRDWSFSFLLKLERVTFGENIWQERQEIN